MKKRELCCQHYRYSLLILEILDDDGIVAPGEMLRPRENYIVRLSPTVTKGPMIANKASKQSYGGQEGECVVDRVALCSDKDNNLKVKIMIRQTRRPEVGDKFSSRHGQKGVSGTIIQQEDFPFFERGICPDLIMNPHGFPSCPFLSHLFFELLLANNERDWRKREEVG